MKTLLGLGGIMGSAGLGVGSLPFFLRQVRDAVKGDDEPKTLSVPPVVDVPVHKQAEDNLLAKFFRGDYASRPWGNPLLYPAAAAVGTGSFFAGRGLAEKVLGETRDKVQEQELEKAKQEYLEALQGQSKLGQLLDELYDEVHEKQASTLANAGGAATGVMMLAALLGGAGGFGLGKNVADSFSNRRLLEEAQKYRRRRRFLRQPSPVLARPDVLPDEPQEEPEVTPQAAPSLV